MDLRVGSLAPLERISDEARVYFADKNQARELTLARSREVIRFAANAIRAVHRREFERARELLVQAENTLGEATTAAAGYGDVLYAGFLGDAQKEFSEASVVYNLLSGHPLPGPTELGVNWPAYLNGLGEAVGELRRFLLDGLRHDDLMVGEALLQAMDDIYDVLVTIDYPDAMTGGLRRTTDLARGILEKTRGDLTVAIRQSQLEQQMRALDVSLARKPGM